MSYNDRPGIYSSYEVVSSAAGSTAVQKVAGLAAACAPDASERAEVSTYVRAAELFGAQSSMAQLVKALLLAGAGKIVCVPVIDSDYAGSFALLAADSTVDFMLCDSRSAEVHAQMMNAIKTASEGCRYRLGIVEADGNTEELISQAQALNCENMVLLGSTASPGTVGSSAAALAGALAARSDPALPTNGLVLGGVEGLGQSYSDSEINLLLAGGVTALEALSGTVCVIRGVTTRTKTAGESDYSLRDISTMLVINDVMPSVRRALLRMFSGCKNTARSRSAIRTQVIVVLEEKKKNEIIDDYGPVSAVPDEEDGSICRVSFSFTVMRGLNRIELHACVTV